MKHSFVIKSIFHGVLLGSIFGSLVVLSQINALSWPGVRGNTAINSVDGSFMDLFSKILVDTGSTSSGKVRNSQKLAGNISTVFQRRVNNNAALCLDSTTPIVDIQADGVANCRTRMAAECGSASGASFIDIPNSNLCAAGSVESVVTDNSIPVYPNSGPYTWTCTRGTVVQCQAEAQGVCNSSFAGRCRSGMPSPVNTIPNSWSHCGAGYTGHDYKWWDCTGSDGSSDRCHMCD